MKKYFLHLLTLLILLLGFDATPVFAQPQFNYAQLPATVAKCKVVELTNNQLLSDLATGIEVVPAPGAGKVLIPCFATFFYRGEDETPFDGGSNVDLLFGDGSAGGAAMDINGSIFSDDPQRDVLCVFDVQGISGTMNISGASNALVTTGTRIDGETVTIGTKVYRFKDALVQGFDVKIGPDDSTTLANLMAAINLGSGSGTAYHAATTLHPTVTCTGTTVDAVSIEDKANAGQGVVTTETGADLAWDTPTLSGSIVNAPLRIKGSATIADGTATAKVVVHYLEISIN